MKRNNELIRDILLYIEDHQEAFYNGFISSHIEIGEYSKEQITYHCMLLLQAGFLIGNDASVIGEARARIDGISWSGHEFLDSIRDKSTWDKIKAIAKKQEIPLTTETIVAVSKYIITKALS